jgi:hypothetical protein
MSEQMPIANVVIVDGEVQFARLYAPGLPDGGHDLFCAPCDPRGGWAPSMFAEMAATREAQAAPADWVMVPREPTPEMLISAGPMSGYDLNAPDASPDADHVEWWRAMIAAAPAAPPREQPTADLRDAKWLDPECADAGGCQSLKFKAQPTAEPVAWQAVSASGTGRFTDNAEAASELKRMGWKLTPLYAAPQPAAEAVREAAALLVEGMNEKGVVRVAMPAAIRALDLSKLGGRDE